MVIAGVLIVRSVRRAGAGADSSGAPGTEGLSSRSGPLPGDLLVGKYRVGSEVGRDDLGVFFDAEEEALPRTVQLYVLRPEYADSAVHRQHFTERADAWMNAGTYDVTDFVGRTEGPPFAVILPRRQG
jgi:hypothetical protein